MTFQGEPLSWELSPLEALRRWPSDQGVLMLHSGRADARWSRYTILTTADGAYRFDASGDGSGKSGWLGEAGGCPVEAGAWSDRPLRDLQRALGAKESLWVGYLGYGLGKFIEKLPCRAEDDRGWPIVQMHRCRGWLVHDNQTGAWSACGAWRGGKGAGMPDLVRLSAVAHRFCAGEPSAFVSRETHEKAVARAIEYIAAGDVFQVNLTQRFSADCRGNPRGLYDALSRCSPAWYGAYLELMSGGVDEGRSERRRAIACTSPELFFSLDGDRNVVTRPIKGTRPAAVDARELLDSDKDAAELTMIVDLLRNDLGRVCGYGSVRVPEARTLESHPTVHHTTATVTGKLHPSKTLVDLIRAVMPGGSITGAPKVRAMEIIDELEPVRRGPYTGAIGYIHGETASFNIAIRTMLVETGDDGCGRVDYAVGGGIVADSTPAGEYMESLDKAAAMKAALAACRERQAIHVG